MYVLFNFILGLDLIFLHFKLIIIHVHYHTPKQRKIKFQPTIKLNYTVILKSQLVLLLLQNKTDFGHSQDLKG